MLELVEDELLVRDQVRRQEVGRQSVGGPVGPVVLLDGHHVVRRGVVALGRGSQLGEVLARGLRSVVGEHDVGAIGGLDVLLELVDQGGVGRVGPVADDEPGLLGDLRLDLRVGHVLVEDRDVLRAGRRSAARGTAARRGCRRRGAGDDEDDGQEGRAECPAGREPRGSLHQMYPPPLARRLCAWPSGRASAAQSPNVA